MFLSMMAEDGGVGKSDLHMPPFFVLQVVGKKGRDFHSESVSLKCTIEKFLSTRRGKCKVLTYTSAIIIKRR